MYTYNVRENGFIIGRTRGKKNAFAFIKSLLARDKITGFWVGAKCVSNDQRKEYTIQKTDE